MDSTTETNSVVSLTVAVSGLGCTVIAAPSEHHVLIRALLRPAVEAGALGPVLILDGADGPCEHEAHLSAAADQLLGIRPVARGA